MKKRRWSYDVLLRYSLFQLPGTAFLVLILIILHWWISLPLWAVWLISLLWVAKDAVMFPLVWRAYDRNNTVRANALTGLRGTAVERLSPDGYVKVRGELWRAEVMKGHAFVDEGDWVRVTGSRGLTLLVQQDTEKKE